jgi:hypothetical protein
MERLGPSAKFPENLFSWEAPSNLTPPRPAAAAHPIAFASDGRERRRLSHLICWFSSRVLSWRCGVHIWSRDCRIHRGEFRYTIALPQLSSSRCFGFRRERLPIVSLFFPWSRNVGRSASRLYRWALHRAVRTFVLWLSASVLLALGTSLHGVNGRAVDRSHNQRDAPNPV